MSYQFELSENPTGVEHKVLQIARTSDSSLPDCMRHRYFKCVYCTLADESTCLLAQDQEFASYLRYKVSEELRLRELIRTVIREHGRPMYWDIIVSMVQARNPGISTHMVYTLLNSCETHFATFGFGVYGLVEWRSKGDHTY